MFVYRIAKTQYIYDLSGMGARLYGGRWNHNGTSMVYTSESRALATVEYLVHVPLAIVPADLSVAAIDIPDALTLKELTVSALPANWRDYPAPSTLAELGTQWTTTQDTLLLRVPSAVVEHEYNLLLNPLHPDMHRVTISQVEAYTFDARLLR